MNVRFDKQGRLVNPSVQLNTSVYSMMKNGTELEDTGEPVFDESSDRDKAPALNFFHELDPMTYKSYDPSSVKAARELESASDMSSRAAANINAVNP